MTLRRVLIFIPIVVIVFLVQSYFWVPTYEEQSKGNPDRLNEYITASIGDAHILNPILSADSSSSQIESMVFEGLLDRDEDLSFRGRLARSWKVYEEAYFYVDGSIHVPGLLTPDARHVADLIRDAVKKKGTSDKDLIATLNNIEDVSVISAMEFVETKKIREAWLYSP